MQDNPLDEYAIGAAVPRAPAARSARPWRDEEDAALMVGFDQGVEIERLARVLRRPVAEVRQRLNRFGRLTTSDDVTRRQATVFPRLEMPDDLCPP
jgi:hypothetical protein